MKPKATLEPNRLQSLEYVRVVWSFTGNEGEEEDEEGRFAGYKTSTKVFTEKNSPAEKVRDLINHVNDIPADYGDGVTNARILAIYDSKTKEKYSIDSRYWVDDNV